MGRNATVLIRFDDGGADITFLINNNTLSFQKTYKKSGDYKITGSVLAMNLTKTYKSINLPVLPSVIFKLKCNDIVQVGEVVNCSIIDVMANANLSILVDFGDGEQRVLYLANSDLTVQKVYATEGHYAIRAESVDKYLNKTTHNATIKIIGGNWLFLINTNILTVIVEGLKVNFFFY
jgi:hypothetical protein